MPINTNLNQSPYFDDFDQDKQYYRVLFKPGFAVQARELIQLQSILQNQLEQFGDNIFKEGSIIKGCNFTNVDNLKFVKITDGAAGETQINPLSYIPTTRTRKINSVDVELDVIYIINNAAGLRAEIVQAANGFLSDPVNKKTFFINYLNSVPGQTEFSKGDALTITEYEYKRGVSTEDSLVGTSDATPAGLAVHSLTSDVAVGDSFGIQSAPGVIFQKGHFLFADAQTLIVSKYDKNPTGVSVGFKVEESNVNALADNSLFDNANGSANENAPGADRLKLAPVLTVVDTQDGNDDTEFFALIRYQNGNAITLRDVSQYNVLGEEMAKRTYEADGNYILDNFDIITDDLVAQGDTQTSVHAVLGTGVAYVKGYRVENNAERAFKIDQITATETAQNQAVSTYYGNYLDVTSFTGHVDIDRTPVNIQNSSGTDIGTCQVVNLTPTKAFITNVNMTGSIADIAKLSDGNGTVQVGNTIKEAVYKPLLFKTGLVSLFSTSDTLIPVRAQETATATNNVITITADPGEDFVCDNDDVLVVAQGGAYPTINSVVTQTNNSELVITLDASGGPWGTVEVYYNKRLIGSSGDVEPYGKVVKEPFIKFAYSSSTSKYSLGFPDVFGIISIEDSAGNDFSSSFRLNRNQKDTHYDVSYLEAIQGRPEPTGTITVQLKVFEPVTSTGNYYFTINSYPNTIESYDIPSHVADSGEIYNLRECFDFRPICDKVSNADYNNASAATAPTIAAAVGTTPTFTNLGAPLVPSADQAMTTDIEYYLSRIDSIVVDSYGKIEILKGKEQSNPIPPRVSREQLAVAEIFIPGYPALSSRAADAQNKRSYSVGAKSTGIKNFTMKDMHSLEKKIDNLSYYISLNQLEQDNQNLTVLDENGLNRVKNGFIVDPFNDLSLANISDPLFNAAIPFSRKILTPSVKQFPIDLKYKSNSNASLFPSATDAKVATLGSDSNVNIIEQPAATGFRTCASNYYQYEGNGVIAPPYDVNYDTTVNPVTIDVDMSGAFNDLIEGIQEVVPLTDVRYEWVDGWDPKRSWWWNRHNGWYGRNGYYNWGWWGGWQTVTVDRNIDISPPENTSLSIPVGDFVSNVQFKPFIASRDVYIYMSGLRPNTRHYFYFDKQDINNHVIPGTEVDDVNLIQRNGEFNDAVETDDNGVLRAVFRIPAETFFVGDRVLDIVDVDSYANIESAATSKGFVTYRAYNFSMERTGDTQSTRMPDPDVNTPTTTRNVVRRPEGRDPLAQTFFIKKGMGEGSNSVFLSQVDVYFKRVSADNGITLQLREVINGFPSNQIIPFSKVHKVPTELTNSESDDASVATTFQFTAPIRLDVEKEYALVLQADANDPNYLLFTSKIGGLDLTPGNTQGGAAVQDWGDGVLFSSTNNSAWKSYQDEDLKFTLYRHNFNQSSGSVTMTHNDHEFFTLSNLTGRFNTGELVYQDKPLEGATQSTVSVASGSATLTGTDLDDTFAEDDFIRIENAGASRTDIFKVLSIDSASQITLNKPCSFAVSGGTCYPVVVGNVSYYNPLRPFTIHLVESSAATGRTFEAGVNPDDSPNLWSIKGLDTEVTADMVSIDDINLSYVQAMVGKTDDSVSTTGLSGTFVPVDDPNATYSKGLRFNGNNHFSEKGVILYSKSNDPGLGKSFEFTVDLANQGNVTSTPFVDIEIAKLFAYQYNITNSADTTSTFISNRVELAADLDAEDLEVTVTGYRPNNTDIKVYIRPQNVYDGASFNEIPWIELELFEGVNLYSSSINVQDYKEFKYRVAATNKDVDGVLEYTSSAGTFSGFRKFAIRIDMLSSNIHNAPTLADYRAIALT